MTEALDCGVSLYLRESQKPPQKGTVHSAVGPEFRRQTENSKSKDFTKDPSASVGAG